MKFTKINLSANLLLICCFFLAACFVRVFGIEEYYFSHDEFWHLVVAKQKNLWELIKYNFVNEIHPPLSPMVWHFMLKISDNHLWLRSASLLASILAIPSAYKFGKIWIGRYAAIAMAIICAFGVMPMVLSSAIRAYSMLILALLWIGIFSARYMNSGKRRDLVSYLLCCLVAIELHHSAALIVFAFGSILLCDSFFQKSRRDFLLILCSHIILAALVLGYYLLLTKVYGFGGNDGYFSASDKIGATIVKYFENINLLSTLFLLEFGNYSKSLNQAIFIIALFSTTRSLIFSKKWSLLFLIFAPIFLIVLSDYFGAYPFSPEPRNNLFLTTSILVLYGYFFQRLALYFVESFSCEKALSKTSLKNLIKEKNISLFILICRPWRVLFSQILPIKSFEILRFVILFGAIVFVTTAIAKNNFFRSARSGCVEFPTTKSDHDFVAENLKKIKDEGGLLVTLSSDIWQFQFENGGDVEVITPNLAKFQNADYVIYFTSFPEHERGTSLTIEEYKNFFDDLAKYLKSQNSFDSIGSVNFFHYGVNNNYLSIISRPSFVVGLVSEALKRKDLAAKDYKYLKELENFLVAINGPKYLLDKIYYRDEKAACGREILIMRLSKEFFEAKY